MIRRKLRWLLWPFWRAHAVVILMDSYYFDHGFAVEFCNTNLIDYFEGGMSVELAIMFEIEI